MAFVEGEIDVLRREMDAVVKVLQINLVRFLQELDSLDEELESSEEAYWMKDLPIQKLVKDYRQTVSNLLTSYTQLESIYKEYYGKLYGYMKAFDVDSIKEELDIIYKGKIDGLNQEIKDLTRDRDLVEQGMNKFRDESFRFQQEVETITKKLRVIEEKKSRKK